MTPEEILAELEDRVARAVRHCEAQVARGDENPILAWDKGRVRAYTTVLETIDRLRKGEGVPF